MAQLKSTVVAGDLSVTGKINGVTLPMTTTTVSLPSSWSNTPPTQTITVTGVTTSSTIFVSLAPTITTSQYAVAAKAQLMATSVTANEITFTAFGVAPTTAIPVAITYM